MDEQYFCVSGYAVTTEGCPDVVSFCRQLKDGGAAPPPLLPALAPGEFPANMECEYFAGAAGGAEAGDPQDLPEAGT